MALVTNGFEGQTNGTASTNGNSSASGAPLSFNFGTGSSGSYDTSQSARGTTSLLLVSGASAACSLSLSGLTANSNMGVGGWIYFTAYPSATTAILTAGTCTTFITSTGAISVHDVSASKFLSTATLSLNTWYFVSEVIEAGTTTSNGTILFNIYDITGAAVTGMSFSSSTCNTGTTTTAIASLGRTQAGSSTSWTFSLDDVSANPGATSLIAAPITSTPPVALFSTSVTGTDVTCTDASTATSPATVASWAWNFGDSTTSTAQNPKHTYAAAGTYTISLTVTDSNGTASSPVTHSVTITAPGTSTTYASITSSTGWTPTSGTMLSVLTDTSGGSPVLSTFAASPNNPSSAELDGILGPLSAPASGQPLIVTAWCDRINSTTGTLAAQIYEGATLRSSVTGIAIPAIDTVNGGSGDGVSGNIASTCTIQLIFPYSDISSVVDWNALTLKMQITAS